MSILRDEPVDGNVAVEELVSAARGLARRSRALAKTAKSREACPPFIQCVNEATELLDAAAAVLRTPYMAVPTIRRESGGHVGRSHDLREKAPRSTDPLATHPDTPGKVDIPTINLAPAVVLRGRCDSISVKELLEFLGSLGKTGTLWVKSKAETFTVQLEEGRVVHASSNNSEPEMMLGAILVRQGAVTQPGLDQFLSRYSRWDGRLGDAMLKDELVTQQELVNALHHQVRHLIIRMVDAREATFTFSEQPVSALTNYIRMNVVELLLDVLRLKDEAAR